MKSSVSNSRVFLDANVLLDIVLERAKSVDAEKYIDTHSDSHEICISALTAHLVVYFGSKTLPLHVLEQFLADFTIIELDQADFTWAFRYCKEGDFEDALQISCAIRAGCQEFATIDKKLAKDYGSTLGVTIKLI
jgi:predicted nucleic acid-binding protein